MKHVDDVTLMKLVSEIFDVYMDTYRDEDLAQIATQATITELFLKIDAQRSLGMSPEDRLAA